MRFDPDAQTNPGGRQLDCAKLPRIERGLPAHSAPLGFNFLEGSSLRSPWNAGAVVAVHGSWDRHPPRAPAVLWMPWNAAHAYPRSRDHARWRVPGTGRLALGPNRRPGTRPGRSAVRQRRPGRRDLPHRAGQDSRLSRPLSLARVRATSYGVFDAPGRSRCSNSPLMTQSAPAASGRSCSAPRSRRAPNAEGDGWQTHEPGPAFGDPRRGRGPGDSFSLPYFAVDDLDVALERIKTLGGTVVTPGQPLGDLQGLGGKPVRTGARRRIPEHHSAG